MMTTKSGIRMAGLGASLTLMAGAAHAGPIVFSDPAAFNAALGETHVESFESMAREAVGSISFGGAMTAEVSASGTAENTVMDGVDGYGAVAMGGPDGGQFWKLRAGVTVIDLGSPWDAFGFWYSDLEGATLMITAGDEPSVALDDNNSGTNHFFGLLADAPFSSVSIAWSVSNGDGVGLDDMVVGRRSVPNSGSMSLVAIAFLGVVFRRRLKTT